MSASRKDVPANRSEDAGWRSPLTQESERLNPAGYGDGSAFERSLASLGVPPEVAAKLLLGFLKRHQGTPEQIGAALAAGDRGLAKRLAHNFKGTVGTIGFHSIAAIAADLEQHLDADDGDAAGAAAASLAAECAPVFRQLAARLGGAADDNTTINHHGAPVIPQSQIDLQKQLDTLALLIEEMSPDALEHLESIAARDCGNGQEATLAALREALQAFDFGQAKDLLSPWIETHRAMACRGLPA